MWLLMMMWLLIISFVGIVCILVVVGMVRDLFMFVVRVFGRLCRGVILFFLVGFGVFFVLVFGVGLGVWVGIGVDVVGFVVV